jgi:HSP20 family molecular chaperone IbpA
VRTIQLPSAVDRAKVTAEYLNGIMTVRLPKTEPAAKTRIAIK